MSRLIKIAAVQLNNGPDIAENLVETERYIRQAAEEGVEFIATPETTCLMCYPLINRLTLAESEEESRPLKALCALAKELKVAILIGSIAVKVGNRKLANRSYLINERGEIISTYDKIHLFDVDLPDGQKFRESMTIEPGNEAVIGQASFAKIGQSICYDIRFPHLYRDMAKAGAQILAVPAAFSMPTGKAHWETLLRARAIETGGFVIAPGQTGEHEDGHRSWGHSMIINPWGEILAEMGDETGIIVSELDLEEVETARKSIPALRHDKDYTIRI